MAQAKQPFNPNDPSQYKSCMKKVYDIHVCMPPAGTIVINRLKQGVVKNYFNGKEYFTADDVRKLCEIAPERANVLRQMASQGKLYITTKEQPFVLAGTRGELWVVSPKSLANTYCFLQNGQPIPINQDSLNKRLNKAGQLDWTVIRSKGDTGTPTMALFAPANMKFQIQTSWGTTLNVNDVGCDHGKGDFVVCTMLPNRQPNLQDRWVVNGRVFADTYNNNGWQECLAQTGTVNNIIRIESLPKLVSGLPSVIFDAEKVRAVLQRHQLALRNVIKGASLNDDMRGAGSFDYKAFQANGLVKTVTHRCNDGLRQYQGAFSDGIKPEIDLGSLKALCSMSRESFPGLIARAFAICVYRGTLCHALCHFGDDSKLLFKYLEYCLMMNASNTTFSIESEFYKNKSAEILAPDGSLKFAFGIWDGFHEPAVFYMDKNGFGLEFMATAGNPPVTCIENALEWMANPANSMSGRRGYIKFSSLGKTTNFVRNWGNYNKRIWKFPSAVDSPIYELGKEVWTIFADELPDSDNLTEQWKKKDPKYPLGHLCIHPTIQGKTGVITYTFVDNPMNIHVSMTLGQQHYERDFKANIIKSYPVIAAASFVVYCQKFGVNPVMQMWNNTAIWEHVFAGLTETLAGNSRISNSNDRDHLVVKYLDRRVDGDRIRVMFSLQNQSGLELGRRILSVTSKRSFGKSGGKAIPWAKLVAVRDDETLEKLLAEITAVCFIERSKEDTTVTNTYQEVVTEDDMHNTIFWSIVGLVTSTKKYQLNKQ